ncbi:MAG: ABC transporter ATP-binding protein [Terrimicrobiaceae bacterium]
MSIAISLHNISKRYRLGTVNQRMLLDDLRDWRDRTFPRFKAKAAPSPVSTPEFWALQDISFEIKKGETVGLIGTNGAGKSTLLKLLARVTTPTTGEMVINGRVGTLLEVGSGFHPELTGRDNVYLNGAVLGMSRVEIDSKFDEILDFAELHQFIDTPVKRYSSGMRVRLAFSVAAIIEPEIMILDEVLAVGDLGFREKCLHRIEVLASGGQTGLFVSHSIGHVSRLCSRVIWLEKGRIRMDGDTDVVCEEYRKAQIIKLAVHAPSHTPALHLAGEASNSAYKILAIETRDGLGRPCGRFRTGEPCRIAVKYGSNFPFGQPIDKVTLRLSILNEQGNRLIGLDSSLVKPKLTPFPDTGTVCFAIPKLPLMEGTYSFSLALSVNGELIDKVIPEAFFLVQEGDFYGTGRAASPSFTPLCVDFSCYLEGQRNPAYRILGIEVLDAKNRVKESFRTAQHCFIAVRYARNYPLDEAIRKVTIRLSLISDLGVRLVGMDSTLVKPLFLPFPDEDTIYFELPKLPLAAGRYSFVVSLFMNAELIDEYVPETLLIVENGDFYGTGRAALPAFAPVCVEYDCYLKGRKGLHPSPSQPVPETVPEDSDEA